MELILLLDPHWIFIKDHKLKELAQPTEHPALQAQVDARSAAVGGTSPRTAQSTSSLNNDAEISSLAYLKAFEKRSRSRYR